MLLCVPFLPRERATSLADVRRCAARLSVRCGVQCSGAPGHRRRRCVCPPTPWLSLTCRRLRRQAFLARLPGSPLKRSLPTPPATMGRECTVVPRLAPTLGWRAACPSRQRRLRRWARLQPEHAPSQASPGSQIGQIGLSTYGEKMLGAGHTFVQQNYAKYLSGALPHEHGLLASLSSRPGNELRYYFTVNTRYVLNKLKLLLFPFSLKGHWTRSHEQVSSPFLRLCPAALTLARAGRWWLQVQAAHE